MSRWSSWKPREVLSELRREMVGKSLSRALPIITEKLHLSPNEYRKFSHSINNHSWRGIMYLKRNSLMGTIFSYFDHKALVIRGYPKIKYSEDSRVKDKEAYAENKYDGTNLGFWTFPDGSIMGKTRMVERCDLQGWQGMKWMSLVADTNYLSAIAKMCADDYSPFGELYGTRNPGEFIRYTVPIDIKFFEVCDLRSMEWIEYNKKVKLLESYGLKPVELYWHGILNMKNIMRLEFEARMLVKEDGYEGFVAKWYDQDDHDTYMAKLKSEDMKELAWSLSPRTTIPRNIISKCVKKAWDNQAMLENLEQIENFVYRELAEEATEELINRSKRKIKEIIYAVFSPVDGQSKLWEFFDQLITEGIDVLDARNKGKVLSMAASRFTIDPSSMYKSYCAFLASRGIDVRRKGSE